MSGGHISLCAAELPRNQDTPNTTWRKALEAWNDSLVGSRAHIRNLLTSGASFYLTFFVSMRGEAKRRKEGDMLGFLTSEVVPHDDNYLLWAWRERHHSPMHLWTSGVG